MSQEAIAGSRGLVILLFDLGSLACLGLQLERRLEVVHILPNPLIQTSQTLAGNQSGEAFVAYEPPDHRAVLLLDPGLVVLLVSPRTGELELPLLTVAQ